MNKYHLIPKDGRKSFYGKAVVACDGAGCEFLESYGTLIMSRRYGVLLRHWDGWTATTGRHIKAFCGLNKRVYGSSLCENLKERMVVYES